VGENEFSWIIQSNGCDYVSDNVIITVNDVYTPTVFTPNNDGQNDFLVFPGVEQVSGTELIVYNRWGTEVYRSSDYQNDWEGRDHKGRELIPDTYFYILKPGSERIIKGFVEIRK
jgi:gliding motility-associated-like protein